MKTTQEVQGHENKERVLAARCVVRETNQVTIVFLLFVAELICVPSVPRVHRGRTEVLFR